MAERVAGAAAGPSAFAEEDGREWLRLALTPGVGAQGARRLLQRFGWPSAIWQASPSQWREVLGPQAVQALAQEPPELAEAWARLQAWLAAGPERQVLSWADPRYPPDLLQLADPPLLLYALGDWRCLHQGTRLAMVGSRNPTAQGEQTAHDFAAHLAQAGVTVVSGLALGIDAAAHRGALDGGGATVAVVGTGLDRVYPARNREMAHRIAAQGVLVSEFVLGTPPLAANFPRRNRLIAGLSQATLVVEAALGSGSLITARCAAEQGKEVLAIPGSIHSPLARGCHALIRQGAKLVETVHDVLEELRMAPPAPAAASEVPTPSAAGEGKGRGIGLDAGPEAGGETGPKAGAGMEPEPAPAQADAPGKQPSAGGRGSGEPASEADPVLAALGFDPVDFDGLQARCGWPTSALQARLLELELEGLIARLPGGMFQRVVRV